MGNDPSTSKASSGIKCPVVSAELQEREQHIKKNPESNKSGWRSKKNGFFSLENRRLGGKNL